MPVRQRPLPLLPERLPTCRRIRLRGCPRALHRWERLLLPFFSISSMQRCPQEHPSPAPFHFSPCFPCALSGCSPSALPFEVWALRSEPQTCQASSMPCQLRTVCLSILPIEWELPVHQPHPFLPKAGLPLSPWPPQHLPGLPSRLSRLSFVRWRQIHLALSRAAPVLPTPRRNFSCTRGIFPEGCRISRANSFRWIQRTYPISPDRSRSISACMG
mmetsp:Transcript_5741/g.12639  ORF Transcript_5741/g.12639 Transcript_5741/m.12639 type:complete len:216 (-) Transcript_5741:154-801(-)